MSVELRDQAEAQAFVAGGLCLPRVRAANAEEIAEVSAWLEALLDERPSTPPPAVVADVGRVLGGAQPEARLPLPTDDERLRAAVRAYEDHVLGRIALEPARRAAEDALAVLPAADRAAAIGAVLAQILGRLGIGGAALSPAVLRRLARRSPVELIQAGHTALAGEARATTAATLADGYEELVRAARRQSTLLGESDVFLLENFPALRTLAHRIGCAQALDAAALLDRALPRRLHRRRPLQHGHAPLASEDESEYPTGGFSGITTSGTLENLVSSELIYMDDGSSEAGDIDLFDVRWVESELLYYNRDEAVLARRRRSYIFAFEPTLAEARFKDPSLDYQRTVMLLGFLVCAVQRLSAQLGEEELHFHVLCLPGPRGKTPLVEELELCELLLRREIEAERAEVRLATPDEMVALVEERVRSGLVDLLVVGGGRPALPLLGRSGEARARVATLSLAEPRPRLAHGEHVVVDTDAEPSLSEAWVATARALIEDWL
jgi:hypothetical protein